MFQAFTAKAVYILLWVMDYQFKFTNFGVVSATHGDFFIKTKNFVKTELTKHCQENQEKDMIILFPEGGFRYKRIESSNKYAQKQNWPLLKHLTWPRAGAFYDVADDLVGVTHIVDCSILYPDQENTLSILDIVMGRKPGPIYFHYRVFEVNEKMLLDEKWLNDRWLEKEQLMSEFYSNKEEFLRTKAGSLRPVQMNFIKLINIHIFFLSICYWMYLVIRLVMSVV
jgi:lysophosphatidylglycerol acyltransferase 1